MTPPSSPTRSSLIIRLRDAHDTEAWREFTEIYEPLVYRLARTMGMQDADAAEATQEVLFRLVQVVTQWEPDRSKGTFRGWLHRVARNVMIRFLQNRNKQTQATGDSEVHRLLQQTADRSSKESTVYDIEFKKQVFAWAVTRIRSGFEEPTWHAFWRTFVEDQSVAEVAEELGMTHGAVYIARSRVLKRLRAEVQRQANEDWMDVEQVDWRGSEN